MIAIIPGFILVPTLGVGTGYATLCVACWMKLDAERLGKDSHALRGNQEDQEGM